MSLMTHLVRSCRNRAAVLCSVLYRICLLDNCEVLYRICLLDNCEL